MLWDEVPSLGRFIKALLRVMETLRVVLVTRQSTAQESRGSRGLVRQKRSFPEHRRHDEYSPSFWLCSQTIVSTNCEDECDSHLVVNDFLLRDSQDTDTVKQCWLLFRQFRLRSHGHSFRSLHPLNFHTGIVPGGKDSETTAKVIAGNEVWRGVGGKRKNSSD